MNVFCKIAIFLSSVVYAAEATVSNDLNVTGSCAPEIKSLCGHVKPGDAKLAGCIRKASRVARENKKERPVTKLCYQEVGRFFQSVAQQTVGEDLINPVKGFKELCSDDVKRFCKNGENVVACLKEKRNELEDGCKAKLLKVRVHEVADARLDVKLAHACKEHMLPNSLCPQSNPGEQLACLKKKRASLNEMCQEEVFRREQNDLEHPELVRMQMHCEAEMAKYCDSSSRNKMQMKCLWNLKNAKKDVSQACGEDLNNMLSRAAQDYRLDFDLRQKCVKTIDHLCKNEKQQVDSIPVQMLFRNTTDGPPSGAVLTCLRFNFARIDDDSCKGEVGRIVGAESILFGSDTAMRKACQGDAQKFCPGVQRGEVHECLRKHLKELTTACAEKEAEQARLEGSDVNSNPKLLGLCTRALTMYCKDVQAGDGRQLKCLRSNMDKDDFPATCAEKIKRDEHLSNTDWRLKYGYYAQCKSDADKLCENEQKSGIQGSVLRCLTVKLDKVVNEECKREVKAFTKSTAGDVSYDKVSVAACADDVAKYCQDVIPGGGRVRRCLLKNRGNLAPACASAEVQFQTAVARDITLDPNAWTKCKASAKAVCPDVQNGQLWKCLEQNLHQDKMEPSCREAVTQHIKHQHSFFRLNPELAESCEQDAHEFCKDEVVNDHSNPGSKDVVGCLIKHRAEIKKQTCLTELKLMQQQRVEDHQLDPIARSACQPDAEEFCSKEKKKGHVYVQNCLEDNLKSIRPACKEFLHNILEQKMENLNFDANLVKDCPASLAKFCQHVPEGKGRRITCLLNHLHEPEMETGCKRELEKVQNLKSRTINLNPLLKMDCSKDLESLMGVGKCDQKSSGWKLNCLTDHVSMIKDPACVKDVRNLIKRQSADIRATPGKVDVCANDLSSLCKGIKPGEGRLNKCLSDNLDKIQDNKCKEFTIAQKKIDTQNASLSFNAVRGCELEHRTFCKDVQPGDGKTLACLAGHSKDGFSTTCKIVLSGMEFAKALKLHPELEMFGLTDFLKNHQAFFDKWGYLLLAGSVGFVVMLGFAISHCVIQRKFLATAYQVVVPKDLEG